MDYELHLLNEIGQKIDEIHGISLSFQRMVRDTRVFLGRYVERRTDSTRGNRCPSYDESKARASKVNNNIYGFEGVDFDTIVREETIVLGNDLRRNPSENLSLGRYENSLLEVLGNLRHDLRTFVHRYRTYEGPSARGDNLRKVRGTLDLIRVAQRQLNGTGHYKFLLV